MSNVLSSLRLGPGWSRVRPWLAGLALLAAINLVAALFITLPRWREARASGAAVRVNQQAQEVIDPALQRARRVYGRVRDAEQELAQLRQRVASRSGSVSEVVATLRTAVDASGLRAERVSYEPRPVPELGLTQLQIALPVRGQYAQLRTFLDTLLSGPIFAVVERIGVATPGSGDTSVALLMNVVLSAFVQGEIAVPPGRSIGAGELAAPPALPVTAGTDPVLLAQTLRQRLTALPEIPIPAESFDLRLGRLETPFQGGPASGRNLFAFGYVPPPPEPLSTAADRERARRRAESPEPVNPYDLLGVIRTPEGLLATIADARRVYNVGEGERLPAGYRVVEVGMVDVLLEVGGREVRLSLRKDRDGEVRRKGPRAKEDDDVGSAGRPPASGPNAQAAKKKPKKGRNQ